MLQFYGYYLSSAAYRVRIALNLKDLPHELVSVHLRKDGGQQLQDAYKAVNPAALVPSLVDGDLTLSQSLAIIEYLDETHPQPALLPADPAGRARVRALALSIACDVHPLNNLRVLKYLKGELGVEDAARDDWYRHWVMLGLAAFEAELVRSPVQGAFCCGETPTLADICLVPQLTNARRVDCDLSVFPRILAVEAACLALPAFAKAAPALQPDAA